MYTLRPLLSWQYFTQASNLYQLYMKRTHGLAADIVQLGQLPIQDEMLDSKQRRLEESMYWSCFKSESEFRVELPLPQVKSLPDEIFPRHSRLHADTRQE